MFTRRLALVLTSVALVVASGGAQTADDDVDIPPIKIVLVGDSTVTDAAGWGKGFAIQMKPEATVVNCARGGASSKSYTDLGLWKKALAEKPDYVLIQFGHNDQPGKGPERETDPATTYPERLRAFIDEARAAGAKPILVTSLARRVFGEDGKLLKDLEPYAVAARKVAREKEVPLIDLHTRSKALIEKLGEKGSAAWAPEGKKVNGVVTPDRTHVNDEGSLVIGRIVALELKVRVTELAAYVK